MADKVIDTKAVVKDWCIDINRIKAKEKKALNAAIAEAQEKADDEIMFPWYARIVVSWPFDGDPSNAVDYGELGLGQLQEVTQRVFEAFQPPQPAAAK